MVPLEEYKVKMIYKGKKIERNIYIHNQLEFALNCLYPQAKILEFKKIKNIF
jgi:hypothetical protein